MADTFNERWGALDGYPGGLLDYLTYGHPPEAPNWWKKETPDPWPQPRYDEDRPAPNYLHLHGDENDRPILTGGLNDTTALTPTPDPRYNLPIPEGGRMWRDPNYNPRTPNPWASEPGTSFSDFVLRKPAGSLAPVSEDPFERAAQRQRESVRTTGGRSQGWGTLAPETLGAYYGSGVKEALKSGPELLQTMSALPPELRQDPEVQEELARRGAGVALSFGLMGAAAGGVPLKYGAATTAAESRPLAPVATIAGTYHSALENHVSNAKTESAPASQWAATIKNAPIKGEELADNGILPWLEAQGSKPVTRQEIAEKVRQNTPEVRAIEKDQASWREEEQDEYLNTYAQDEARQRMEREYPNLDPAKHDYYDHYDTFFEDAFTKAKQEFLSRNQMTKYGPEEHPELSTPGGENYKETVLTLNKNRPSFTPAETQRARDIERRMNYGHATPEDEAWYNHIIERDTGRREQAETPYQSSHWDEPNVLAHYRTTEHVIPGEGQPKAVGGAGEGFENVLHGEEFQSDWHQQGRRLGYRSDYEVPPRLTNAEQGVFNRAKIPDAPFKKSWHELAFKHFLKKAIDDGMDAVTWTKGETQLARYPGLRDTPSGGSGMQSFYDKIMVNSANKLGKRYGAKVGERNLNEGGEYNPEPVHYMKITPAMRDAVKQSGFSLYEDTSPEAPLAAVGQRKDLTTELKRAPVAPPTKEAAQMTLEKLLGQDHIAMPSPQFSLAKAVENMPAETATPRQWLSTLASAEAKTGGPLEKVMEKSLSRRSFLSGAAKMPMVLRNLESVSDWLGSQQGLLTKQQVLEHIAPQIPKLKVIERKGLFNEDDIFERAAQLAKKDGHDISELRSNDDIHESYTQEAEAQLYKEHVGNADSDARDLDWHYLPEEKPDSMRHVMLQYEPKETAAFHGSSGEPNILAEYRTSDRDIAGANTLHSESFNSEWHEAGERRGYGDVHKNFRVEPGGPPGPPHWVVKDNKNNPSKTLGHVYKGTGVDRASNAEQALEIAQKRYQGDLGLPSAIVPDAPLKDNWHEVAFDHFLKKAIDEGYDAVSWGKHQQKEYNAIDDFAGKVAGKYGARVEDQEIHGPEMEHYEPNQGQYVTKHEPEEPYPVRFMRITPEMKEAAKRGVSFFADESPLAPLAAVASNKQQLTPEALKLRSKITDMTKAGKSYGEIADELGISRGAVAGQINRIRKAGVNVPSSRRVLKRTVENTLSAAKPMTANELRKLLYETYSRGFENKPQPSLPSLKFMTRDENELMPQQEPTLPRWTKEEEADLPLQAPSRFAEPVPGLAERSPRAIENKMRRMGLDVSTGNPRGRRLTNVVSDADKQRMIDMFNQGMKDAAIGKEFGLPRATVAARRTRYMGPKKTSETEGNFFGFA